MQSRSSQLPAGPRLPKALQTVGWWTRPIAFLEQCRARYGKRFERFLDQTPGTYTWIPFGGGRRRCLGASFAMLEMKTVLHAFLARNSPRAVSGHELSRRRSITLSPRRGAVTVLKERQIVAPV